MRRLSEVRWPFGLFLSFCLVAACSNQESVPADEMSAEELARAIEKAGSPKEIEKAAQPLDREPVLEPLQSGDVDPAFAEAALCSFSSAAGVMMMATRDRLIARLRQRPATFRASGPVAPDGGYFTAGDIRISVGLSGTARDLPQIGAGGAEARISMPKERRFTVPGNWSCKLQRAAG